MASFVGMCGVGSYGQVQGIPSFITTVFSFATNEPQSRCNFRWCNPPFINYIMQSQFVFFDFDEPLVLFFLDYLAVMAAFVWLGHALAKVSRRRGNAAS